jgi:hypothetical protein
VTRLAKCGHGCRTELAVPAGDSEPHRGSPVLAAAR